MPESNSSYLHKPLVFRYNSSQNCCPPRMFELFPPQCPKTLMSILDGPSDTLIRLGNPDSALKRLSEDGISAIVAGISVFKPPQRARCYGPNHISLAWRCWESSRGNRSSGISHNVSWCDLVAGMLHGTFFGGR